MSINNIDRQLSITPQSNITEPTAGKDKQATEGRVLTAQNPFHGKTLKFFRQVPLSQHPSVIEHYTKQVGVNRHLSQFIESLTRRFNQEQHT
jgi:hypothetical protein